MRVINMPTEEYYLKQAQVAARMALAEPDRVKSARLQLLALEHFEKAEKVKTKQHHPARGLDEGDHV